jgi:hypothetical protein
MLLSGMRQLLPGLNASKGRRVTLSMAGRWTSAGTQTTIQASGRSAQRSEQQK